MTACLHIDLRNPIHLLATGFGSGLAPRAPGTFHTLAGIPPWLLLQQLPAPWYWLVMVAAFALGVHVCGRTARDMGVHDHGALVWDEFVGLWLTLAAAPVHWFWVVTGFVIFRVLDILKPWPIRWFDRNLQGGLGVMADDVVAGLLGLAMLHILQGWISI